MNEKLDLCKILEGCEGMELWSPLFGKVFLDRISESRIIIRCTKEMCFSFDYRGCYYSYPNAECTLFPSKDQRDWSKFEKPIKEGTPMMCTDDSEKSICDDTSFIFARYSHTSRGVHYVKRDRCTYCYDVMIPFDKFDPNNIEESLKYNIQK